VIVDPLAFTVVRDILSRCLKWEGSPQPRVCCSALTSLEPLNIISELFVQTTRPAGRGYTGSVRVRKPRECQFHEAIKRGEPLQLRTPLIRRNGRKYLRDFRNLRTQVRFMVPAALDQRPDTVRARTMCRPGRTVAPQYDRYDHPVRRIPERNLTGEHLCWWDNSKRKKRRFQIIYNVPRS
jgi:hypothetical protein